MTSYSFSYSTTGATNQPPQEPERYSFNSVNILRGPEGLAVLQHQRSDQRMFVNSDVAAALNFCKPFRTLEQHVSEICGQMPSLQGEQAAVLQTLQDVCGNGLLESAGDALKRLKLTNSDLETSESNFLQIAIITCDRPEALSRLLNSITQRPLDSKVQKIWVIDDSRQAANIERNAEACTAAKSALRVDVAHFDDETRARTLDQLVAALPEAETPIRFALDRNRWPGMATYGLARNWAQLVTAGSLCLVFDDDVLCEAVEPPLKARGLRFDALNSRDAVFYSSVEEQQRFKLTNPESPITLMSRALGSRVATALNQYSAKDLTSSDGELTARYNGTSKIRQMQTGTWGDPGTTDNSWMFFLPSAAIDRLLAKGDEFATTVASRAAWAGFKGPTLTAYGSMSQLTGLDNRELLPPYFPVLRGEDLLFSMLMNRIYPDSPVLNTAWAVPHHPVDERPKQQIPEPITAKFGMTSLSELLGQEPSDQWGLSPETRLRGIAQEVRRLSEMAPKERAKIARHQHLSRQIALLNNALAHISHLGSAPDSPPAWTTFIETTRDGLIADLQKPLEDPIADIAARNGIQQSQLTALGLEFAQCLDYWPAIRERATQLLPQLLPT